MKTFRHPAFAKLSLKLDRAENELRQVGHFVSAHPEELSAGEWGALGAVSLGIHNVYNGIEDILLSLANDVDGLVPRGPSMHQDILDQMSAPIAGIRPAMLGSVLQEALGELKAFRHLVRHRYGFDLKPDKVQENLDRLMKAWPAVVDSIVLLEKRLLEESDPSG
ncbi:MAG: hypothetical protein KGZ68_07940 [Dechloromonas sp.]|nr:hypothetical protein [Dechloromonas sp.]